ncbi:MAG: hypothetical protein AAF720_07265 [Pseudomonadota bacterium]
MSVSTSKNDTQGQAEDQKNILTHNENSKFADKSVTELQDTLQNLAPRAFSKKRGTFSRAAELQLIDELSRNSASGVGLLTGLVVFAAVMLSASDPARTAVWVMLFGLPLFVSERLRRDFRSGGASAARPFRWRSDYCATLAAISTSIGSGIILFLPTSDANVNVFINPTIMMLVCVCSLFLAGMSHTSHRLAALALLGPGCLLCSVTALKLFGLSLAGLVVPLVSTLLTVVLGTVADRRITKSLNQFPPTTRRISEDVIATTDDGAERPHLNELKSHLA